MLNHTLLAGNGASRPEPEAIASRALPQLDSGLVKLPSEIKEMIFQKLWNDAGIHQHLILRWGRVVGMTCVTDVTGPDEVREEYVDARASIYGNITFCIYDLDTLHHLKVYRPSLLLDTIQHLQLTIRLPLPTWLQPKPSRGQQVAMERYRECCQALEQAENLVSMYLWLDVVDPPARRDLYTVPEGDMNPYVFGKTLASKLTVDLPVNPDRPEAWRDVAGIQPRFAIRPRGWPRYGQMLSQACLSYRVHQPK
ncbi:hypothetical protein FDECE_15533 [Fusarium decemcellulare]|nr:hypothetical protein FDECE_15533 [Fusarium decemcellulare]